MNSTQKLAWLLLLAATLSVATFAYVGSIIASGRMPPRPLGQIVVGAVTLGGFTLLALTVFFLTRRQSSTEPEADERDKMIRARAVTISFASTWSLLVVVLVVLGLIVGQTGSIQVYWLTVILLGVAVLTMLICGVTMLVQYGRGGKDE
jgi:Na+/melibiose symporter-like transporter